MTSIKEKIASDLIGAMRKQDKKTLGILRLIASEIKKIEVDQRISLEADADVITILQKMSKQRKESIVQFQKGGREDLVAQEEFELTILNQYLPAPLSESEVTHTIQEAIDLLGASKISDMGKVMEHVKARLQGRADMSKISMLVKSLLS